MPTAHEMNIIAESWKNHLGLTPDEIHARFFSMQRKSQGLDPYGDASDPNRQSRVQLLKSVDLKAEQQRKSAQTPLATTPNLGLGQNIFGLGPKNPVYPKPKQTSATLPDPSQSTASVLKNMSSAPNSNYLLNKAEQSGAKQEALGAENNQLASRGYSQKAIKTLRSQRSPDDITDFLNGKFGGQVFESPGTMLQPEAFARRAKAEVGLVNGGLASVAGAGKSIADAYHNSSLVKAYDNSAFSKARDTFYKNEKEHNPSYTSGFLPDGASPMTALSAVNGVNQVIGGVLGEALDNIQGKKPISNGLLSTAKQNANAAFLGRGQTTPYLGSKIINSMMFTNPATGLLTSGAAIPEAVLETWLDVGRVSGLKVFSKGSDAFKGMSYEARAGSTVAGKLEAQQVYNNLSAPQKYGFNVANNSNRVTNLVLGPSDKFHNYLTGDPVFDKIVKDAKISAGEKQRARAKEPVVPEEEHPNISAQQLADNKKNLANFRANVKAKGGDMPPVKPTLQSQDAVNFSVVGNPADKPPVFTDNRVTPAPTVPVDETVPSAEKTPLAQAFADQRPSESAPPASPILGPNGKPIGQFESKSIMLSDGSQKAVTPDLTKLTASAPPPDPENEFSKLLAPDTALKGDPTDPFSEAGGFGQFLGKPSKVSADPLENSNALMNNRDGTPRNGTGMVFTSTAGGRVYNSSGYHGVVSGGIEEKDPLATAKQSAMTTRSNRAINQAAADPENKGGLVHVFRGGDDAYASDPSVSKHYFQGLQGLVDDGNLTLQDFRDKVSKALSAIPDPKAKDVAKNVASGEIPSPLALIDHAKTFDMGTRGTLLKALGGDVETGVGGVPGFNKLKSSALAVGKPGKPGDWLGTIAQDPAGAITQDPDKSYPFSKPSQMFPVGSTDGDEPNIHTHFTVTDKNGNVFQGSSPGVTSKEASRYGYTITPKDPQFHKLLDPEGTAYHSGFDGSGPITSDKHLHDVLGGHFALATTDNSIRTKSPGRPGGNPSRLASLLPEPSIVSSGESHVRNPDGSLGFKPSTDNPKVTSLLSRIDDPATNPEQLQGIMAELYKRNQKTIIIGHPDRGVTEYLIDGSPATGLSLRPLGNVPLNRTLIGDGITAANSTRINYGDGTGTSFHFPFEHQEPGALPGINDALIGAGETAPQTTSGSLTGIKDNPTSTSQPDKASTQATPDSTPDTSLPGTLGGALGKPGDSGSFDASYNPNVSYNSETNQPYHDMFIGPNATATTLHHEFGHPFWQYMTDGERTALRPLLDKASPEALEAARQNRNVAPGSPITDADREELLGNALEGMKFGQDTPEGGFLGKIKDGISDPMKRLGYVVRSKMGMTTELSDSPDLQNLILSYTQKNPLSNPFHQDNQTGKDLRNALTAAVTSPEATGDRTIKVPNDEKYGSLSGNYISPQNMAKTNSLIDDHTFFLPTRTGPFQPHNWIPPKPNGLTDAPTGDYEGRIPPALASVVRFGKKNMTTGSGNFHYYLNNFMGDNTAAAINAQYNGPGAAAYFGNLVPGYKETLAGTGPYTDRLAANSSIVGHGAQGGIGGVNEDGPLSRIQQWAQASENAPKIALFKTFVDSGMSDEEAAGRVAESQIDYGNMPDAIKFAAQSGLMPFANYGYASTRFMLQTLAKNPVILRRWAELRQSQFNAYPGSQQQYENSRDYQKDIATIPVGVDKRNGADKFIGLADKLPGNVNGLNLPIPQSVSLPNALTFPAFNAAAGENFKSVEDAGRNWLTQAPMIGGLGSAIINKNQYGELINDDNTPPAIAGLRDLSTAGQGMMPTSVTTTLPRLYDSLNGIKRLQLGGPGTFFGGADKEQESIPSVLGRWVGAPTSFETPDNPYKIDYNKAVSGMKTANARYKSEAAKGEVSPLTNLQRQLALASYEDASNKYYGPAQVPGQPFVPRVDNAAVYPFSPQSLNLPSDNIPPQQTPAQPQQPTQYAPNLGAPNDSTPLIPPAPAAPNQPPPGGYAPSL